MRVITGTARGIQLKTPTGFLTRPTAERVKEALFSAIQFDIPGARVLDLFAGTGQLGIEALSRGAARAVFVDMRLDACRLVREICGGPDCPTVPLWCKGVISAIWSTAKIRFISFFWTRPMQKLS